MIAHEVRLYAAMVGQNACVSIAPTRAASAAVHPIGMHAISLVVSTHGVALPSTPLHVSCGAPHSRSTSLNQAAPPCVVHVWM